MSDFPIPESNIKSNRCELVDLLLKKRGIDIPRVQAIPCRSDARPCQLSFAQQRLWFLDQLEPGNSFYNRTAALHLSGQLKVAVLEQSFKEIVRRHETLRTTFTIVEGQALQVINPHVTLALPVVDLREFPEIERQAEVLRLTTEEGLQPFDLAQGPLLRVTLLRLAEEEYVVILTIHHIVCDGWSISVLVKEVAALYEAFSTGNNSPLPELPVQYADFAVWQRQWLQGQVLEAQMSYWKQQLSGAPSVLELPTDRPRALVQTYRGATKSLVLPKALTKALNVLSQQESVTLFMTLLAAFKTLLYRYTGQDDILVGSPIANRNRSEIEGLIGFFVNTLILRTDLSGNPSFRKLLRRVREVTLGAYTHQDLPFEKVVEELKPERRLNRNPMFDVMFILQNAPMEVLKLPALTISDLNEESQTANFDLTLSMMETERGLIGSLEYRTDLFDATTIEQMLRHFQVLLQGIVAHPDQCLSDLPILTEAERQQVLVDWNNTHVVYSKNLCVHQLFEAQVERSPDAIAVVFEDQQVTYWDLNARANQLAHHLRLLGVGPEVLVGICVERSLEMVVGLLGILKAGGAYVPLDPAYPKERLNFILLDSQVSVLLTQEHLVEGLPKHGAYEVCLDKDWAAIAQEGRENSTSGVAADNLAYLIYTSGSTGEPKGVQIPHRAVVNFLNSMQQQMGLIDQDVLLAVTSLSFDIAALELFLPMIIGASVKVVCREVTSNGAKLLEKLLYSGATVMQATPATWRLLLKAGWQGGKHLKILCGGEALPWDLANQLLERNVSLWNLYGPTETTIWSTTHQVNSNSRSVSIGRPIANTQVYVLDGHLKPVPVGVPGELYISGVGLARGYLNRPDLTAEKFLPNPFSNELEARLYKTGDLVRYLSHGNIEFLGRIDQQVKVRGFRIELGEIEAVLNRHPGLLETVVVTHEDVTGNRRLIAYIVSRQAEIPNTSELNRYLKQKLPEYMVPSAFVPLKSLPLTPNGKIDRRALPALDIARPELAAAFVAPGTSVEKALVEIWGQVLGVEKVGIHDNFFELGGHSLLATQLISKVRDTFQAELPLHDLFEVPTVAGLAKRIETIKLTDEQNQIPPIQPVSRDRELPLSFPQQRLWFLYQLEPSSPFFNMYFGVRIAGLLNVPALKKSLNEIVRRHEVLRTTFALVEGRQVQVIVPSLTLNLPVLALSALPETEREAEVQKLSTEEFQRPFELERGPLLRTTLLQLAEEEHVLLLTLHHIVCDGWSMRVFTQEIVTLYKAYCAGCLSPLPKLPIQYADFTHWQRQWLRGKVLEAQLSYWKEQLDNAPVLELFTDRPRSSVQTFQGARQSLVLPRNLSEALMVLSQREGVTLFITLLAVFKTLLYQYSEQEDILIGSPRANRILAETEPLIGLFTDMLALRTDLSGNPRFRELLGRVRDTVLRASAHQNIPFELVMEILAPRGNLLHPQQYQVEFVFLNFPWQAPQLEIPNLTLSFLNFNNRTAKIDATLYMWKEGNELKGYMEYNTGLFNPTTIIRMLKQFQILLERVITDPEQHLLTLLAFN